MEDSRHNHIRLKTAPFAAAAFPLLLALVLVSGCSIKKVTLPVPVKMRPAFTQSGNQAAPVNWWKTFGDEKLNQLIKTALGANFDLKTAWYRLKSAQAVVRQETAEWWPGLEAEIGAGTSRSPDEGTENSFQLGFTSEYEFDLWGRIRSSVDAQRYQARATYADFQTAAITLSAEVAKTWYQIVEAGQQLVLISEQIATNKKVLDLIKSRFGSGLVRRVDILRQEQLIASGNEQKIEAESRSRLLNHQLALLMGVPPQQGAAWTGESFPELPQLPQTGVPAGLIRRRPDVVAAYNRLQSADRELASAVSSLYPRLSLRASYSKSSESTDNIFKNWLGSLASNLLAPIFAGGRIRAEIRRTQAVKKQRLNEFGQAVLVALREVEDALVLEHKQVEQIKSLELQFNLARQSHSQLRTEYFNGLANYLEVLISQKEEQQLRRSLVSAGRVLLEYRISLYRALAGGLDISGEEK